VAHDSVSAAPDKTVVRFDGHRRTPIPAQKRPRPNSECRTGDGDGSPAYEAVGDSGKTRHASGPISAREENNKKKAAPMRAMCNTRWPDGSIRCAGLHQRAATAQMMSTATQTGWMEVF